MELALQIVLVITSVLVVLLVQVGTGLVSDYFTFQAASLVSTSRRSSGST